jgi:hypothetical protein
MGSGVWAFGACGGDGGSAPTDGGVDAAHVDGPSDGAAESALTAPADGPSAAGPGDGGDLGVLAAFCDGYAKAVCDRLAYCDPGAPTAAACESEHGSECRMWARVAIGPAIRDGLVIYDPAQAAKCFASPMDLFCATNDLATAGADCAGVFRGTSPQGGDCYPVFFMFPVSMCASGACVGGTFPAGACAPSKCTPYLAPAASCIDDAGVFVSPGCGPNALCTNDTHACEASRKPGDPCTSLGDPCNAGQPVAWCIPPADGSDAGYVCGYPRDGGEPCGAANGVQVSAACRSHYCAGNACVDEVDAGKVCFLTTDCPTGTFCQGAGTLTVCQRPVPDGGACVIGGDNICAAGLGCISPDAGSVGACQPLPSEGQSCDQYGCDAPALVCAATVDAGQICQRIVASGAPCAGPLTPCDYGTTCLATTHRCGAPSVLGGPCADDTDCDRGLYCADDTKTCAAWKRSGTACKRDGECVFGSTCTDAGVCYTECTPP